MGLYENWKDVYEYDFLDSFQDNINDIYRRCNNNEEIIENIIKLLKTNEKLVNESFIWQDFIKACKPIGGIEFIDKILAIFNDPQPNPYPIYFNYLILFILPLTENEDDYRANMYYERLMAFLRENKIISANYIIGTHNFRNVDPLWGSLSNWATDINEGRLGVYNVKNFGVNRFVGKPFAECVLTLKQKKKLNLILSDGNIGVGEALIDNQLIFLIEKYGKQCLGYTDAKWNIIIQSADLKQILINNLKDAHLKWNGTGRYVDEISVDYRWSTYNAFFKMKIDQVTKELSFALLLQNPDPTNIYEKYVFDFNEYNLDIFFNCTGWSDELLINQNSLIKSIFDNGISIKDFNNEIKAKIPKRDIILFGYDYHQN